MNLEKIHKDAAGKVNRWSSGSDYLDTDRLRGIGYGNLVLRHQSHLYLAHGVVTAAVLLGMFWIVSVNWDRFIGFLGLDDGRESVERPKNPINRSQLTLTIQNIPRRTAAVTTPCAKDRWL